MTQSIKPHLDKWRTMINSSDADGRLSAEEKALIFSTLEGLISLPRLRWQERANGQRSHQQSPTLLPATQPTTQPTSQRSLNEGERPRLTGEASPTVEGL
mgnify:CR=1 FL=1